MSADELPPGPGLPGCDWSGCLRQPCSLRPNHPPSTQCLPLTPQAVTAVTGRVTARLRAWPQSTGMLHGTLCWVSEPSTLFVATLTLRHAFQTWLQAGFSEIPATAAGPGGASRTALSSFSAASCPALSAAPAMAPQHVQVTPLTASQLEVAWDPPPPESQNGNVQGYKAMRSRHARLLLPGGRATMSGLDPRWNPGPTPRCPLAPGAGPQPTSARRAAGHAERQEWAQPSLASWPVCAQGSLPGLQGALPLPHPPWRTPFTDSEAGL